MRKERFGLKKIVFDSPGDCYNFFKEVFEAVCRINVVDRQFTHCSFTKPDGEVIQIFWKDSADGEEATIQGGRFSSFTQNNIINQRTSLIEKKLDHLISQQDRLIYALGPGRKEKR